MSYKYNLNIKTSWSSLPWQKIYTKISVIQKKIYTATKCYKFNKVYKLQKYLLNSNESKIASIRYIIEKTCLFLTLQYKKKLFISNGEKFKILKSLYSYTIKKNKNYCFLIDQIQQRITYLSIKPEYLAKFILNHDCYKKILKSDTLIHSNLFYNRNNNAIKKTKLFKYFKNPNKNKYFYSDDINKFMKNTYFCNLRWYFYHKNKLFILVTKKNNINIKQFLINIKNCNHIKHIQNILLSNKLNKFIFTIKNIKSFYLKFNKIIFYKLKKKYNNIFYKYIFFLFHSKIIHRIFHIRQLRYIYINYCI
uniref:Reverse transcriptase N-terminal domain-containing protein n=1 Tax=Caloglossa monosticha TaxID=76906 RepID=A0A1Z1M514_9FLOR|nr:hypothetical protein [Caloglossa monosticha]ARW61022.1 hypothetical protein [Caloglossa monosticha]